METTIRKCENCKQSFHVPTYRLKHQPLKFCSNDCRYNFSRKDPVERFWMKVETLSGKGACWLWKGTIKQPGKHRGGGYGLFRLHSPRRNEYAHRFSYILANGPIPDGKFILHKCSNPSCVNPKHLYAGTAFDNMRDMVLAGRFTLCQAKITADDVRTIRSLHGKVSGVELLKRFPISKVQLHNILRRDSWRHVK